MSYKEKIYEIEEQICWLEYVLGNSEMIQDEAEEMRLLSKLLETKEKRDNLKKAVK